MRECTFGTAAIGTFKARGDKSGTNATELRLWKTVGQTPDALSKEKWYREIGGGRGQALNAASAMDAYTLSNRGTWHSFNNKGSLVIAVEGDPRLINRYDVIELDPRKRHKAHRCEGLRQLAGFVRGAASNRRVSSERAKIQPLGRLSAVIDFQIRPAIILRLGRMTPKRLRGLEVDDKLDFGDLLDRKTDANPHNLSG